MKNLSLDELAAKARQAQSSAGARTPSLVVDREGNIGEADRPGETQHLSTLTGETFAAAVYSPAWIDEQRATARLKLPANTREVASAGVTGWAFSITTEFGDTYTFWAAYDVDDSHWAVYLLSPRRDQISSPGRAPNAHDIHLFADGRLCLTPTVGCRSLEHAFARSALWARGASCYRQGLTFTFNRGQ